MTDEFDSAVADILKEFGAEALYIQTKDGEYDPATGSVESSVKKFSVRGALFDFSMISNGLGTKFGTELLAGDKQFLMQPPEKRGGIPIKINPVTDRVRIGVIEYKVVAMKETNLTGSNPILYELVLRR